VVRLPAGWYPDPTGLPQLRWWDNHAWTQHTTAARQPLIVQESPLAWAEDLPTRRERREREREDRGTDDLTPATAQTLLELDPPSETDEAVDAPAPEADDAGIDHAVVTLRVSVGVDGRVGEVRATSDPGAGFGREARACALSKPWSPALDRAGRPAAATTIVNVRFDR
ncbi:MAG: DUF2510 domain-containing protein, partial [Leifsonia sp.]